MALTVVGSLGQEPSSAGLPRSEMVMALTGLAVMGGITILLALIATDVLPPSSRPIALDVAAGVTFVLTILVGVIGKKTLSRWRNERLVIEALDAQSSAYAITGQEDSDLVFANPSWRVFFPNGGRPIANLRDYVSGEDQRNALDIFSREVRAGRIANSSLRVRVPGLDWQRVEITATPLYAPVGILWRIEDVTARERERELAEHDWSTIQQVFDEVSIGLFSINGSGKFLTANATLAGWLGTTPEALLREGARLQDFLLPSQPGSGLHDFDPYAPAEGIDIILQGRQGRLVKLSISQSVHRDGSALETRSIVRDLTSERTWDDAVRVVRRRFQRFFEVAPVGIALVEGDGRFYETNNALERLLTDGQEKLKGRSLYDFIGEDAQAELKARLVAALSGKVLGSSLDLRLKGQKEKTVAVFVSRLEADDGEVAGAILHFIDLTDQKNLEIQFAQSQKMQAVGQLAGGVAHDFNNLLTAMIGFCDLLLLRFRPGDQSFADIMQIKQNANRAANLVRQLLAFSRQQTLQPRILGIGDVLSELSHLLNRLLGDNIELKMLHGRNLGSVKVDQGQLEQVIINLAVNARDAMPDGGTLTLRTSSIEAHETLQHQLEAMPAGAYVLIEVTDDGLGIPREIITRIFEPFFSTKEMGSGTGLGLSTVYGIVKQTGGFVFVDSTVGVGTKFTIYLPQYQAGSDDAAEKAPLAEALESRSQRDLTGAGTILLVEDEDPVRLFSARALRNKGYQVLEAKSGESALKLISETTERIDLILTDVVMPRMDGPTMIKHVRETLTDVKVIFISGYAEDTFRKRLDDDRDIHFLPKPFSLKQLAAKVKDCLSSPTS